LFKNKYRTITKIFKRQNINDGELKGFTKLVYQSQKEISQKQVQHLCNCTATDTNMWSGLLFCCFNCHFYANTPQINQCTELYVW